MSPQELQEQLRQLSQRGTLLKDRGYRQVWRLALQDASKPQGGDGGGDAWYVKFYPRGGGGIKRVLRGSPALREFTRLQWLQKARIPAPRALGVLMGFTVNNQIGDALVLQALEPSQTLLQYLQQAQASAASPSPPRRQVLDQLIDLLSDLAAAGLRHTDLHLDNFLLSQGRLHLLDGYAVRRGSLTLKDLWQLGDSARAWASRADVMRVWRTLVTAGVPPQRNPHSGKVWEKLLSRIFGENRAFGQVSLKAHGWSGVFCRQITQPPAWSVLGKWHVADSEAQAAAQQLVEHLAGDETDASWTIVKQSRSGAVYSGQVALSTRAVEAIIKRPRRRYWHRYINEIGRGGRARRAWKKSWQLIVRGLPTAWPLMLLEKRRLGYLVDSFIVYEKIEGRTLAQMDLAELSATDRQNLFRRTGRVLRQLEQCGRYHWDAKSSNWMIRLDRRRGPVPLLVDVDGIRSNWGIGEGMRRLHESLLEHPQYTPADSLELCLGYAPFARVYGTVVPPDVHAAATESGQET